MKKNVVDFNFIDEILEENEEIFLAELYKYYHRKA